MLCSTYSSANPVSANASLQNVKPISQNRNITYRKVDSKPMQLTFTNQDRNPGEKRIYAKVMSQAKMQGFEIKNEEAMKIAHIVDSALDNKPPEAASINIKVTIHLKRPVKIEVEVSL